MITGSVSAPSAAAARQPAGLVGAGLEHMLTHVPSHAGVQRPCAHTHACTGTLFFQDQAPGDLSQAAHALDVPMLIPTGRV